VEKRKKIRIVACLAEKIATPVTDTMQQWGLDCERDEGGVSSEELEEMSRKLIVRIRQTETYLEAATSIFADLEHDYECLKALLGDATVDMEQAQAETSQAGNRLQSSEKVFDEYKRKVAHLQSELETWQCGSRHHIAVVRSLWAQLVNLHDKADYLRLESKTFQGEHRGLPTQLPESGRSQHETGKIGKTGRRQEQKEENVEMELDKAIVELGGGSSTGIANSHLQELSTTA